MSRPLTHSVEHCAVIMADKARARVGGIYNEGCRCGERLSAKAGGRESLATHTLGGAGEGETLREGSE
jgi:hypothetical protein